jgi:hypothetical protein
MGWKFAPRISLEAEWTLVTVVADALVERGTLTRKQFKTLVTQTAQKAVTEAPQGRGYPADGKP